MCHNTNENIIEVPRYDVPELWEARDRRRRLRSQGIDPDQIVRVLMTSSDTGDIIEYLPVRLVNGQRVPI